MGGPLAPAPAPRPRVVSGPGPAADAEEAIAHLQALIRIPSVNPPGDPQLAAGRDTTGGETAAARYCAEVLTAAGIPAEVLETVPGPRQLLRAADGRSCRPRPRSPR